MRRFLLALMLVAMLCAKAHAQQPKVPASFEPLLGSLWPDAQTRGISRKTFGLAFAGLTPDPRVAALTTRQLEYGIPVATYLARIASQPRIEGAARRARDWKPTLDALEKQYGVDRWIILALWGIETSFGANPGGFDVIRSLATLVAIGYRADYFRDELIAALQVLQQGPVPRGKLIGSWAGAMGQPQFMPSNFLELAVDFDRDGRKDIWANVPDVMGSIANFLKRWGWKAGSPWGCEVVVPQGFDYRKSRASYTEWSALGLTRTDRKPMPQGYAILFFPSGAHGPAFLVGENFEVIKRYNNSDVFALAATQIADRAQGRAGVRATWPADDPQLTRIERVALQKRMKELGHPVNEFDGRIDFDLRDEIRREQAKHGMVPDGHPTRELMERIGVR